MNQRKTTIETATLTTEHDDGTVTSEEIRLVLVPEGATYEEFEDLLNSLAD